MHNTFANDVATALTGSLASNGERTSTANQPMGGFKHTGVGDATARTQYATAAQVEDSTLTTLGSVSGTDTITAVLTPVIVAYASGQKYTFIPANTNTGAATININAVGAKNILKASGSAVVAGDIVAGVPAVVVYNGTSFYLQNPQSTTFLAGDGAVGTPSYSFTSDPNTGVYRVSSDVLGFSAGGVRTGIDSNGVVLYSGGGERYVYTEENAAGTGAIIMQAGAGSAGFGGGIKVYAHSHAAQPGAVWLGYSIGSATGVKIGTGGTGPGTEMVRVFNNQLLTVDGTAAAPAQTFISDPDTGIYRGGTNSLYFTAGGTYRGGFDTTQFNTRVQNTTQDGTVGAPAYSFENDNDSGLWRAGANQPRMSAGGADITIWGTTFFAVRQQTQAADGSVGTPGVSFENDPDTGMYRAGANNLRFVTNGTKALEIDSTQKLYDQNNFELGYKQVPRSTTATTLVAADLAKCVAVSAAIAIPASVFAAGDAISIYNDSGSSVNITIAAGTLRLAGSTTTGTRALAARGLATLWFNVGGATPEVIASGPGLT